jgi:multicomponent Na+:H+ antiporter subunit D
MKVWIAVFWSPAPDPVPDAVVPRPGEPLGGPLLMVAPTAALAALTLAIGLAAGPIYDYSVRAAADLLDPSAYVTEVLG